jgi:hypothetical protein
MSEYYGQEVIFMKQQQDSNLQQQNVKDKSEKERKQDIKNAEYIAKNGQPNHPNT